MDYFGLDIHKHYTVYTHMNEAGKVLGRGRLANERAALQDVFSEAEGPTAVVMEATYHWYHLFDLMEDLVEEVHLAHPLKVRAIAEARIKTDKIDATVLAHLLRTNLLPEAHIPPKPVRERRELLRYRASLVGLRQQVKNKVHAILAKNGLACPVQDLFGKGGFLWLQDVALPGAYRQAVDGFTALGKVLQEQIGAATQEVRRVAAGDPLAMLLTTMPGIGYHNALLIVSEVGDIERFPDARHLASYAGLVPSVYASGGKVRYGRITKAGSRWLRWALVQSAHAAARQPGALRYRFEETAHRKGRKVAIVALARFMLKTVYHLLKEQQPYREDAGSSRCDMAL